MRSVNNILELDPFAFNDALAESPIAYIPFGTIEWHGPHLPLGVDTYKIEELCKRAAEISGGFIFPTITWNRNTVRTVDGVDYEGVEHLCQQMLPGNLHYVREETLDLLIEDMMTACLSRGFKAVCIWSGHNAAALTPQMEQLEKKLQNKYPARGICVNCRDERFVDKSAIEGLCPDLSPDHAGKWETSMMMAMRPDLVSLSKLNGKPMDKLSISNNGVLESAPELGEAILELCSKGMGLHMRDLLVSAEENVPIPQPMPEIL